MTEHCLVRVGIIHFKVHIEKESIKAVSFHRLSRAELNSDLIQSQEKLCFFRSTGINKNKKRVT